MSEPLSYSCVPAGCGQFPAVCTRLDRQNWRLDDWLWEDCSLATTPHLGPPHSLGRGQSRRWLPVGLGQPHWYTDRHVAAHLNVDMGEIYSDLHQFFKWVTADTLVFDMVVFELWKRTLKIYYEGVIMEDNIYCPTWPTIYKWNEDMAAFSNN